MCKYPTLESIFREKIGDVNVIDIIGDMLYKMEDDIYWKKHTIFLPKNNNNKHKYMYQLKTYSPAVFKNDLHKQIKRIMTRARDFLYKVEINSGNLPDYIAFQWIVEGRWGKEGKR